MVVEFTYKIFSKAVASNCSAVHFEKCHQWNHIKGNRINLQTSTYLQKFCYAWYCLKFH